MGKGKKLKPPRTPKSDEAVPVHRNEAAAVRTAQEVRAVEPRAAPQHATAGGCVRAARIWCRGTGVVIPAVIIPVPAPLKDVTRHVIQPVAVGAIRSHRYLTAIIVSHRRGSIVERVAAPKVIRVPDPDSVSPQVGIAHQRATRCFFLLRLGR